MRLAAAIVVAGVAIAGAAYLASLHLGGIAPGDLLKPPHARAAWQIPVAILIAMLGVAAAVLIARPRSGVDVASGETT